MTLLNELLVQIVTHNKILRLVPSNTRKCSFLNDWKLFLFVRLLGGFSQPGSSVVLLCPSSWLFSNILFLIKKRKGKLCYFTFVLPESP